MQSEQHSHQYDVAILNVERYVQLPVVIHGDEEMEKPEIE